MMLLVKTFSLAFFILYTLAGISDMIDGAVARKYHIESKRGALLDSIADIVFLLVTVYKILPHLLEHVNARICIAIIIIGMIRITAYAIGTFKYHRFVALHTYLNKITGFVLFICVYLLYAFSDINILCALVCALSGVAAFEELIIVLKSKYYNPDTKSILRLRC